MGWEDQNTLSKHDHVGYHIAVGKQNHKTLTTISVSSIKNMPLD